MESTVEAVELGSGIVSGKRPAEEDVDALKENVGSPAKRVRGVSERNLIGGVKKVAEMVLVMAAMGKMRGGKGPTDVEKELMVEARNRLAEFCEVFAPKDVFPRDAFGGVIEDLGLNKLKEQMLGFRPPKMSIAEKLLVSKRKMEKAEDFSLTSTPQLSRPQSNSGAAVESRSALHPVQMSQSVPSGGFQSASPSGYRSTVNSTSLPYQLPTSEIRPIGSNSLPSSRLSSAALPRVDHLRPDGRPNGSSHPAQLQANFYANSTVRTPTWSTQPQSSYASKSTPDCMVPVNMSLKLEGAGGVKTGLAPQMTSRTVVGQALGGPSSQVTTNHGQPPPAGYTHAEIGKIVQKLLQPQVSERPSWNPPSRDYMNKALTCQICMSKVTEIESILICDACEKGYHIKCLQTTNQKGIPNGEWHCGKCLSLSNGKPLPPKYGRVMRNSITPKMMSNKAPVPSTSIKQVGASTENVGEPKVIDNGQNAMETTPKVADSNDSHQTPGLDSKEDKRIQEIDNVLSRGQIDDKVFSLAKPNNLMENSSSSTVSSAESLVEKTSIEKVDFGTESNAEMVPSSAGISQAIVNSVTPSNQSPENYSVVRDSKESPADESSNNAKQLKEQEVVRDNPSGVATSAGAINQGMSSIDGLHAVNWVGDPLQVVDEKIYYALCCINGHQYKATDHVLIRGDTGKLIPSKLQAMWEDKNTSAKWVAVNQCYFPGDLPEAVGRPCGLESSEVYESTCGRSLLAGLIESPCEVLPSRRFAEETEKRTQPREQLNDPLPPLFLCKSGFMMKQKGYSVIYPANYGAQAY
ncbi:hypothetical protein CASFOL_019288 [Castilleja foliolosa]|uniref:PHD finger protein n=1 Tax=Castilleja foliolosa TaxID=1961234 RepID=A0ABD3D573_9LAMI